MPSPQRIKLYLEAVAMYRQGQRQRAAQLLAESLGATEPSPVIQNSLDKLLQHDTRPNDAVLQVLATEAAKGAAKGVTND